MVHADNANTDYSPTQGAADLTLAWERHFDGSIDIGPLPWTINLGPTIDPNGRVYLTSTVLGCHLQALDGATGATLWCSSEVNLFAVASSPLLDREGRLFIADGTTTGLDGTVYVPTIVGGLYAFRPAK